MKTKKNLLKPSLIILVLFTFITNTAFSTPIKVGIIAPLTGDFNPLGKSIVNGMNLANKNIAGYNLKLITEDNVGCSPKNAVSSAHKLISVNLVDILVTVCTASAKAILPIAKAKKFPYFKLLNLVKT